MSLSQNSLPPEVQLQMLQPPSKCKSYAATLRNALFGGLGYGAAGGGAAALATTGFVAHQIIDKGGNLVVNTASSAGSIPGVAPIAAVAGAIYTYYNPEDVVKKTGQAAAQAGSMVLDTSKNVLSAVFMPFTLGGAALGGIGSVAKTLLAGDLGKNYQAEMDAYKRAVVALERRKIADAELLTKTLPSELQNLGQQTASMQAALQSLVTPVPNNTNVSPGFTPNQPQPPESIGQNSRVNA